MYCIKELTDITKFVYVAMPSRREVYRRTSGIDQKSVNYKTEPDFTNEIPVRTMSKIEQFDAGAKKVGDGFVSDYLEKKAQQQQAQQQQDQQQQDQQQQSQQQETD